MCTSCTPICINFTKSFIYSFIETMRLTRSLFIRILLILSGILKVFALQSFQDFFPDGKYCLTQELTNKHESCSDAVVIRTKYPYLILWKENQKKTNDHHIHVVKPHSWPDFIDLKSAMSAEDRELHFTLHNTSFHLNGQNFEGKSVNCTLNFNGLLLIQTVTFKRVQNPSNEHYCTMNNLIPGKWKYDPTLIFQPSKAWSTCPSFNAQVFEHNWQCPAYHVLQYFPDSHCNVLPLRQSLFLLYHHIQDIEGLIINSTDHPYFFFLGDSLVFQLCVTSRCELHSHANMILTQPPYHHNASMRSLGYQSKYRWNQFLRSDLPCSPSCSDESFRKTKGFKPEYGNLATPCQGCPDGNISRKSPSNHPEVFYTLHELPLSVRVLVVDAGAWFISDNVRGEDSTTIYKETLEAFVPHLVYFQKQRNYQVDIYFLALPGIDPSLSPSPSLEWSKFEEKNQVIYEVFSSQSLSIHNLSVTILPNDNLFQRKHLIDGMTNMYLPDNLHYCAPGAFSPDSFLFELIVHNHVIRKLKIVA